MISIRTLLVLKRKKEEKRRLIRHSKHEKRRGGGCKRGYYRTNFSLHLKYGERNTQRIAN